MFLNRAVVLLPLLFILQACKDEVPSSVSAEPSKNAIVVAKNEKPEKPIYEFTPPAPNLSSPDNAVKSWWALTDAIARASYEECKKEDVQATAIQAARRSLAAGSTKEFFQKARDCRLEDFERTIERASVETDTRAVVMTNIKNVTQLPAGSSLSKYAKDNVEKGLGYKYVLTRESDKWYIEEVYSYSSTNVILKRDPWDRNYKNDKHEDVYLDVRGQ